MELQNTRSLVAPDSFKWKVLVVGKPGLGKSTFLSTAPGLGVAACETGHGAGLLSVAHSDVDFVEPKTFTDFRSICLDTFAPFQGKETVGLDSLSAMTKSFIKDHVLSTFPSKNQREAMRRQAGVMTGFDYGDLAEVTRTLLNQLLAQKKNIVVTCLEKTEKDDNGVITQILPDLPGALAPSAAALFDSVLYLKVRKAYRDPRDPKTAYYERYFITNADGIHVAKDRNSATGKPFLAQEEIFDLQSGKGTFPDLFAKLLAGHAAATRATPTSAAKL